MTTTYQSGVVPPSLNIKGSSLDEIKRLMSVAEQLLNFSSNKEIIYGDVYDIFNIFRDILKDTGKYDGKNKVLESIDRSKNYFEQIVGGKASGLEVTEFLEYNTFFANELPNLKNNDDSSFLIIPLLATNHMFSATVKRIEGNKFSVTVVNTINMGEEVSQYEEYVFTSEQELREAFSFKHSKLSISEIYGKIASGAKERYKIPIVSRDQVVGNCFLKQIEKGIRCALLPYETIKSIRVEVSSIKGENDNLAREEDKFSNIRANWELIIGMNTEEVHMKFLDKLNQKYGGKYNEVIEGIKQEYHINKVLRNRLKDIKQYQNTYEYEERLRAVFRGDKGDYFNLRGIDKKTAKLIFSEVAKKPYDFFARHHSDSVLYSQLEDIKNIFELEKNYHFPEEAKVVRDDGSIVCNPVAKKRERYIQELEQLLSLREKYPILLKNVLYSKVFGPYSDEQNLTGHHLITDVTNYYNDIRKVLKKSEIPQPQKEEQVNKDGQNFEKRWSDRYIKFAEYMRDHSQIESITFEDDENKFICMTKNFADFIIAELKKRGEKQEQVTNYGEVLEYMKDNVEVQNIKFKHESGKDIDVNRKVLSQYNTEKENRKEEVSKHYAKEQPIDVDKGKAVAKDEASLDRMWENRANDIVVALNNKKKNPWFSCSGEYAKFYDEANELLDEINIDVKTINKAIEIAIEQEGKKNEELSISEQMFEIGYKVKKWFEKCEVSELVEVFSGSVVNELAEKFSDKWIEEIGENNDNDKITNMNEVLEEAAKRGLCVDVARKLIEKVEDKENTLIFMEGNPVFTEEWKECIKKGVDGDRLFMLKLKNNIKDADDLISKNNRNIDMKKVLIWAVAEGESDVVTLLEGKGHIPDCKTIIGKSIELIKPSYERGILLEVASKVKKYCEDQNCKDQGVFLAEKAKLGKPKGTGEKEKGKGK